MSGLVEPPDRAACPREKGERSARPVPGLDVALECPGGAPGATQADGEGADVVDLGVLPTPGVAH